MHEFLPHYVSITPTTWAYLSSLLAIALYFKFNRILSLRNIDLVLLILIAPGLVLVEQGFMYSQDSQKLQGYLWLFGVSALFLVRMLLDSALVRRPLLEANLSRGGMIFLGVALFLFLSAKVLNTTPNNLRVPDIAKVNSSAFQSANIAQEPKPEVVADGTEPQENQVAGDQASATKPAPKPAQHASNPSPVELSYEGPGFHLFYSLVPNLVTPVFRANETGDDSEAVQQNIAKYGPTCTIAIISHLAIVIGIVMIGYLHFGNLNSGIAAGLMYLLLPYTVLYIGWVRHVLPAALLIWAVVLYRRALLSGILIGLASGTVYYPIFLLPLWMSFYWQRGKWRFSSGVLLSIAVLSIVQAFYVESYDDYVHKFKLMLGLISPTDNPEGFWSLLEKNLRVYRLPVMTAHVALCWSFAIWPVQKNLGTLMSGSAALMISTQFWAAYGGGISMAWYMPLLLLSIFRPNLEDRVALSVLGDGWLKVHRNGTSNISRAA